MTAMAITFLSGLLYLNGPAREKDRMSIFQSRTLRTVLGTLAVVGGMMAVSALLEAQARHVDRKSPQCHALEHGGRDNTSG